VLITSSISGEGKTFTSLNMASILSLGGKRVVLMGVDLRKPKMFDDLGLSNQKGLSTYLAGKHSIEEIVQHTGRGELYFVSAGPVPPNPSELLLSPRFDELMQHLRSAYDFVVLDTPPVTLIADAFELMRYSDVNMYVMRQGVTPRSFVSLVEGMHQSKQIKNGCVVLNDYQANLAHQYGYRYAYYDVEPKNRDKPGLSEYLGGNANR
jgi:capsular exopolysaccharide synthesis family protein